MDGTFRKAKADFEQKLFDKSGFQDAAKERRIITDLVNTGYGKFAKCGYPWSFLEPFHEITLTEGSNSIRLPDCFAGFIGRPKILATSTSAGRELPVVGPGDIERQYTGYGEDITGEPCMVSLRAVEGTTPQTGDRSEAFFDRIADANYSIKYQYYLIPNALTDESPWVYGGAMYSETIMEFCLAELERFLNDTANGPHFVEAQRMMAASQAMDGRRKQQTYGLNRDHSDDYGDRRRRTTYPFPYTINGVDVGD